MKILAEVNYTKRNKNECNTFTYHIFVSESKNILTIYLLD